MPKPKKKAPWLIEHEDKVKELEAEIQQFLKNVDICIESSNTSDELKDINGYKQIFIMEKIIPYRTDIIKNLESKKINAFKNFIIKFFTLGKTNKNKDIDNKITSFKADCEIKLANIKEEFIIKEKNMLIKKYNNIMQKRNQLQKENSKLEQNINNLEQKISNLEEKNITNIRIIKTLKSESEDNNKFIAALKLENKEYQNVQDEYNQKSIDKFITLNNMLKAKEEETEFYKNNFKKLEKNLESRDSGVESASEALDYDINSFNKNEINIQQEQVTNKKNKKVHLAQIQESF